MNTTRPALLLYSVQWSSDFYVYVWIHVVWFWYWIFDLKELSSLRSDHLSPSHYPLSSIVAVWEADLNAVCNASSEPQLFSEGQSKVIRSNFLIRTGSLRCSMTGDVTTNHPVYITAAAAAILNMHSCSVNFKVRACLLFRFAFIRALW